MRKKMSKVDYLLRRVSKFFLKNTEFVCSIKIKLMRIKGRARNKKMIVNGH